MSKKKGTSIELAKKLVSYAKSVISEDVEKGVVGFEVVRDDDGYVVFPVEEDVVSITGKDGKIYAFISVTHGEGVRLDRGYADHVENYMDAREALSRAISKKGGA